VFPLHTFCACIHQRTLQHNAGPCTWLSDVANYKWAEELKEKSKLWHSPGCTKKSLCRRRKRNWELSW